MHTASENASVLKLNEIDLPGGRRNFATLALVGTSNLQGCNIPVGWVASRSEPTATVIAFNIPVQIWTEGGKGLERTRRRNSVGPCL